MGKWESLWTNKPGLAYVCGGERVDRKFWPEGGGGLLLVVGGASTMERGHGEGTCKRVRLVVAGQEEGTTANIVVILYYWCECPERRCIPFFDRQPFRRSKRPSASLAEVLPEPSPCRPRLLFENYHSHAPGRDPSHLSRNVVAIFSPEICSRPWEFPCNCRCTAHESTTPARWAHRPLIAPHA